MAAGGCRSSWAASGPFGPAWTEAGRRGLLSTGSWCHVPISLVRFLFHLISPPSSLSSSRAPSSSSTLGFYKILRSYDYRIGGGFFSNFLPSFPHPIPSGRIRFTSTSSVSCYFGRFRAHLNCISIRLELLNGTGRGAGGWSRDPAHLTIPVCRNELTCEFCLYPLM